MARRRPVDFVGWRLYRRTWVVPVLALLVLLATSFRAEVPVQGALPPTLANDRAVQLLDRSQEFTALFPDRRPGSPGAIDSAQWMLDEFRALDLAPRTVPATTTDPATGRPVGLVNVEGTLRGRTRELVVIHAHRDTADGDGRGSDAVGQVALLTLARELAATRDRRRTYLFVSTDGATLNGGGARALANRLRTRGAVVAVIGLDRIGGSERLRVDAAPSGNHAPPLGLVQAASGSVAVEGGSASLGGLVTQMVRLATPLTLREHGQLLDVGLPAITITAGDDQLRGSGDDDADAAAVGDGLRATQRLVGTLDGVDQLQSAGKTWIATEQRVYRGWALKILVASLLVPVWIGVVDMLVRHRRGWNLPAALGTCVRAMLAGIVAVGALWLLGAFGLLPGTVDRPPNPGRLSDVRVVALGIWLVLVVGAWLLARGPDWRRQRRAAARVHAGPDTPEIVGALVGLVVVSVLALAVNPFAVLFVVPSLHAWMCIASWRIVFHRSRAMLVWAGGLIGPLLGLLAVGARSDAGAGTGWYALQLVQTRTVPPTLALLVGAGGGLTLLLLVAATGRVAHPALPQLRSRFAAVRDGEMRAGEALPAPLRRALSGIRVHAVRLRVPSAHRAQNRRRGGASPPPAVRSAAARTEATKRRRGARSADDAARPRVKTR